MSKYTKRNSVLGFTVAFLLAGCGARGSSNTVPENNGENTRGASSVLNQVDASLRKQGWNLENPLSLEGPCTAAGGKFDSTNQECFCPGGALFTTGTSTVECVPMAYQEYGLISFQDNKTDYQAGNPLLEVNPLLFGGSLQDDFDINADFKNLDQSKKLGDGRPFRLSIFWPEAYLENLTTTQMSFILENEERNSKEATFDCLYSVIEGKPFTQSNTEKDCAAFRIALYEPNEKYLDASLGVNLNALSKEDEASFSSLNLDQVQNTLVKDTLLAYQSFRRLPSFVPTSVKSPYASGCATYCVASEPIAIDQDPATPLIATYEKVYQLGTPSTRVIVLRDQKTNFPVAIISLNVAETVSTVNFLVSDQYDPNGKLVYANYFTYDRNGKFLFNGEISGDDYGALGPFSALVN